MVTFDVSQAGITSPHRWTLLDWDRELAVAQSWDQLHQAILEVPKKAKTPNTIVNLVSPQGDTLSFGVASRVDGDNPDLPEPVACINFTARDRNPPYLTVIGNPELKDEEGGIVVFRYEEGTWTEILRRNCVSLDTLVRVVHAFFTTGQLPDWIQWEEV